MYVFAGYLLGSVLFFAFGSHRENSNKTRRFTYSVAVVFGIIAWLYAVTLPDLKF